MYDFLRAQFKCTTAKKKQLLEWLFLAHYGAALKNPNISQLVAFNSWKGSRSPMQGIAAGLLSTGGDHAPVIEARNHLSTPLNIIEAIVKAGEKIPGYGNSFYKDKIDPEFQPVFDLLPEPMQERMYETSNLISTMKKKPIRPNAAGITAGVADVLNLPTPLELALFIIPRTTAWLTLMK